MHILIYKDIRKFYKLHVFIHNTQRVRPEKEYFRQSFYLRFLPKSLFEVNNYYVYKLKNNYNRVN